MYRFSSILFFAVVFHFSSCSQKAAPAKVINKDFSIEKLLKSMTLDEKIGQMNQYNGFWDATGPAPAGGDAKQKYDHLNSGRVGSVLNVTGVENVKKMQPQRMCLISEGFPTYSIFRKYVGLKV